MIFIRPWFLLLLLIIPLFFHLKKNNLLNNPWKKIINPEFLPFLLVHPNKTKEKKHSIIWISLLWSILVFALAGPALDKIPIEAQKNTHGTVLIVDLNSLTKTTLPQLKIKLNNVIQSLKGERVGLVLYDEKGYVALPMTEDIQILQELVPVLDASVLPAIGNKPYEGFKTAIELLQNNNLDTGRILFFTGGTPSIKETLSLLKNHDYSVGILGFGSDEKTPLLSPDGKFKRDAEGNILLTSLNKEELSKLGIFEPWQPQNGDIDSLIQKTKYLHNNFIQKTTSSFFKIDTYKDLGIYLLLIGMPFIALFFRKGLFVFLILFCTVEANASIWLRDDQILYNLNKKAVANYKKKDYLSALAGFKNDNSETGIYNQANATAHMKKYQEAIDLYNQVLKTNPNHKEARFNKEYLEQMMKNNQSSSQGNDDQKKNKQNQEQNTANQNNEKQNESDNKNTDNQNSNNSKDQNNSQKEDQPSDLKNDEMPSNESTENNNDQVYPQPENQATPPNKEDEKQPLNPKQENEQEDKSESDKQQNSPQKSILDENNENKNSIDQESQEIFNRLKKDPSRLLRYRLYEQNRRKP